MCYNWNYGKQIFAIGIQESAFKNYDPKSKNVLPLLYQSGYLIIKYYYNGSELYTLGIPNREVEKGLFEIRKRDVRVEGEVSLNCFPGYPFGSIRIIKINQLSNNCSKQDYFWLKLCGLKKKSDILFLKSYQIMI